MRIIGFGAHPDDIELFFFGMLAAARATGADIGWVIATDGSKGGEGPADRLRVIRREEATEAAALLSVTPLFLDRIDGELAADPAAAKMIEDAILEARPDLVVTHAPNDYHPDHRALSRLVADAARFYTPVLYADTLMGVGFEPTHYVDIGAYQELKHAALGKHVSQRPQRFIDAADTWNRFRALQCNTEAGGQAEAFRFVPVYPFGDIRTLLPPPPPVRPLLAKWRGDG
ncbi:MAG: PIG-L deacetylase family protein [Dongiaceae bacterium]